MLILTAAELQIRLNRRSLDLTKEPSVRLLSGDDLLDVVKFVEGFEGGEVVDVKAEDLVADLTEHGIVELEERELHAFARGGDLGRGLAYGTYLGVLGFELLQNDIGAFHDAARHTSDLCHMDTKGVLTASTL